MSSITLNGVTKFYGDVEIIKELSITFEDKQFITLLGPSGCGKTTLLRMIAGFEKPTSGEIKIDNLTVSSPENFIPPNERNIGMVFQSYAVWPHMNVFDNVAYPLRIKKFSRREINQKVSEILEAVHLSQYVNRMPNELSGGQQQRVALGRALVSNPRVLLLDEPLSNLDAKLRESMRFEIKDMQKKFGITIIYVTHDQSEAMAMSDKIIIFNNGEAQQIGTPVEIYNEPVNQFVADFIGKINFIHGDVIDGKIIFSGGQNIKYNGKKRGHVVVAVRPEDMTMSPHNGMLRGTLSNSYYLGDINDCRIDLDGTELRVVNSGRTYGNIKAGEIIWLDFDRYHVFEE